MLALQQPGRPGVGGPGAARAVPARRRASSRRELGVSAATVADDEPRVWRGLRRDRRAARRRPAATCAASASPPPTSRSRAWPRRWSCRREYGVPLPQLDELPPDVARRRARASARTPQAPSRWSFTRRNAEAAVPRPRRRSSSARGRARPRPGGGRRGRCGARRRGRRRSAAARPRGPARATGASSAPPRRRPGGNAASNARAFAARRCRRFELDRDRLHAVVAPLPAGAVVEQLQRMAAEAPPAQQAREVVVGRRPGPAGHRDEDVEHEHEGGEDGQHRQRGPRHQRGRDERDGESRAAAPAAPADRSWDGEHADASTAI